MKHPIINNNLIENANLLNSGNYIIFSLGFILEKEILCHIAFPLGIIAFIISISLTFKNWHFQTEEEKKILANSISASIVSFILIGMYIYYIFF